MSHINRPFLLLFENELYYFDFCIPEDNHFSFTEGNYSIIQPWSNQLSRAVRFINNIQVFQETAQRQVNGTIVSQQVSEKQIILKPVWKGKGKEFLQKYQQSIVIFSKGLIKFEQSSKKKQGLSQLYNSIMANNVILVTGSYDHTLVFWDAQQGHATSTIEYGDKQIVNRIEISLDKKYLGVAASLTATYYDLFSNKQQPVHVFDGYTNNVTGIGFQKDSLFMYTGSEDGSVKLHDLRQNNYPRQFNGKEPINSIVLHPNEAELIVADQAGNIRVYDLQADKQRLKITPCPDVGIRSLSIAQNASTLVAADSSGVVHCYTLQNADFNAESPYYKIDAHQDYILKTMLSPDLKFLATCSADKTVRLWTQNAKNQGRWDLDKCLYGHSRWVWDCAFSCDSEYIITVGSDCMAKIWQTDTGDVLRNLKQHKQGINCLALNDIALE